MRKHSKIAPRFSGNTRILLPALAIGVLALMITPVVWAAIPILQSKQGDQLTAGPLQGNGGGFGSGNADAANNSNTKLISYLQANQGNAKFLVAVPSSMSGDSIILATNKPVMALGGFSGSDPILTTNQLSTLIANGTVRFFLLNGPRTGQQIPPQVLDQLPAQVRNAARNGGFAGFGGQQSAVTTYVTNHCAVVPTNEWQSASSSTSNSGTPSIGSFFGRGGGASKLYDCATTH